MERDSFVFYRSWLEAIENLPRDMQGDALLAITRYAIFGDASADGLKPIAKAMLTMAKPQIDVNNQRYVNGCSGGRKTKSEPNGNQTETKRKPNENVYENDNVNVSSNEDNINPHSPKGELPPLPGAALPQDEISVDDDGLTNSETTPPPGSAPPPSPVEKRERTFRESLAPFVSKYGEEMIRAFCDYWTERNKSGTKMRFEMEKTWDTARRLVRWDMNNNKFKRDYGRKEQRQFGNTKPGDFAGKGYTDI